MTPALGMPVIWHSYTCDPCGAMLARGGEWAEINCPGCGRPMERLAEHRYEVSA